MSYNKDKLVLVSQGLSGRHKIWFYYDTGDAAGDIGSETDSYFTDGKDMGIDTGDFLFFRGPNGTGATNDGRGYMTVFSVVDTGGATTGITSVTLDTS